jgi:hypothetical protein
VNWFIIKQEEKEMKKLLLMSLVFGLSACKDITTVNYNYPDGDSTQKQENLAGMYYMEDNGVIELVQLGNGNYIIYGTQRVITKNADASLTLFPNLPTGALTPIDNKLTGYQSMSYSATNNVKTTGNVVINGSRLTYFEIKKVDGRLNIKMKVFGTNNTTVEHESEAKEL